MSAAAHVNVTIAVIRLLPELRKAYSRTGDEGVARIHNELEALVAREPNPISDHVIQIKSGRQRGLWFAHCRCGWESLPTSLKESHERQGQEHVERAGR